MRDLPITRPTFPTGHRYTPVLSKLAGALWSGIVTNNGPRLIEFEGALKKYLDVPTICFSSGTAALIALLKAGGVGRDDEVICPSFTFPATIQAIRWCGATPVYADIDPKTWTLDVNDIERRITTETKAILGVDVYGIPCDYGNIKRIADKHDLMAFFDSAPSFGSLHQSRPVGAFFDGQIFSFHATKPFSTMEGGCLCSNHADLIEKAKSLRNFGQRDGGIDEFGFNGKMMEVCAVIGLEQLKVFPQVMENRHIMSARMIAGLSEIDGIEIPVLPLSLQPNWLYMPIVLNHKYTMGRDDLIAVLARKYGIFTRRYYPACHKLIGADNFDLPVTDRIAANVVSLPVYNDMTEEEVDRIVTAVREK